MAFVEPVAFQEDGLGDEPGAAGRHPGLGQITRWTRPEQWVPPTANPCLEGQAREGTAWVPKSRPAPGWCSPGEACCEVGCGRGR